MEQNFKSTWSNFWAYNTTLDNLSKQKGLPINWAIVRSKGFAKTNKDKYSTILSEFVDTFCKKDDSGKPILKEGKVLQKATIFDYEHENIDESVKRFNDIQNEEIEVQYYKASEKDVKSYIETNPAADDYELLIGNIIDPALIEG